MTSLRNVFLAASLVAAPFAFAPDDASASTVTGSVTYAAEGTVTGGLDGSAWILNGTGSFSATGGLSDYLAPADDWTVEGMVHVPGLGMLNETETFGSPISALALMGEILPYDTSRFLFTIFANAMVGIENAIGGAPSGSYTFGGGWGLLPAGDTLTWSITDLAGGALPGEGGINVTGNFSFTLSGSNVDATIASVTEFFLGVPLPTDLVLAGLPDGPVDVKASITLSPVNSTPHVIPVPAALPLLAGGLGVLGLMGWRRRRA